MDNLDVTVEFVSVDDEVKNKFASVPYWVGLFMERKILEGFEKQAGPDNIPWAPLAKSTIEARRKRNSGGLSILTDSGKMKASLTVTKDADSAILHMDSPAGFHQSGTRRMPARRIVPTNGEIVNFPDSWNKELTDFVGYQLQLLGTES